MKKHMTGTRQEWLAARIALNEAEKELTRQSDALAQRRQELPWVRVDKDYRFETEKGSVTLPDLFRGRSQLLVYHFMFGPDYKPLAKLKTYKQRMGWSFPWASSAGGDFNFDFNVSFTEEQQRAGTIEYNFRSGGHAMDAAAAPNPVVAGFAATCGTDAPTYTRDRPGLSTFVLEDGVIYHCYSAYARGVDGIWSMYQWLDRAPKGRNEASGPWWRRHDEYASA
jgi:predicted dithiol-disulfide oxidoreductase (DUF899 family)